MTYQIKGAKVTLTLSAEEIGEVIDALELVDSESELLSAFRQYREEEFA
jgi:hypothetical protein